MGIVRDSVDSSACDIDFDIDMGKRSGNYRLLSRKRGSDKYSYKFILF